ncbi:MAG TPA: hypothetical protein VHL57_03760 [Flavobacteriales bacterium]|jgi:hypothetical protein|nr:hypothetical protein [Flavobacteriales bacterium]
MQITGITPSDFQLAVHKANIAYGGNLTAEITSVQSPTRFRARVVPVQSGAQTEAVGISAPGARKSWSGRRIKAACWHAYRDVMIEVFNINPDARIYTGMAKYKGREGFEANYPRTADQNIGSMVQPAYMPDLCECEK